MGGLTDPIEKHTGNIFKHIRERYLNVGAQVIGLGSGKTVAGIVSQMRNLPDKESLRFIVSSLQIELEAEHNKLNVVNEDEVMNTKVLFDGADQLDCEYHMIKGGGGALFREKILFAAARKIVILADSSKYVKRLTRAIPIEVHPFARTLFVKKIRNLNVGVIDCKVRILEKGFPFFSENGNIIFDVSFESIRSPTKIIGEIKDIPGVIEVGIFPRPRKVSYYKINQDNSFDVIKFN